MPTYLPKLADEVPPPDAGRIREKRKIKDIEPLILYDDTIGALGTFSEEPTLMGIRRAVDDGDVDLRPYHTVRGQVLMQECGALVNFNPNGLINLGPLLSEFQKYHARRVAFFVLNEWTDQIIGLNEDGKLCDGGHRYRAAIFMGWDEVWIERPKTDEEVAAEAPPEPAAQA